MSLAIIVSNMNILGQKLNEVLRGNTTDGKTGGRRTKQRMERMITMSSWTSTRLSIIR